MAKAAESKRLVDNIVRLRRAERVPAVARDVAPARRELESRLGPTLSRSRAAQILGVSQTALDRWVAAGQVPIVLTPGGRREVPRQFVVEVAEAIEGLRAQGRGHHLLAAALGARRDAAAEIGSALSPRPDQSWSGVPRGHRTAEDRSRANHSVVADRLTDQMVDEARERVEQMAAEGHLHPTYAERWRQLLSRPNDEIAEVISADDQESRDLRQNSPFAGVLNEQERRRIIEAIR